jgi:hypothetical protein
MRSVLQASGAKPLIRCASRDPHVPARPLQPVVDEAGTRHRLDRRQHGALRTGQATDEMSQAVAIGRTVTGGDPLAVREQRVPVETLAAQVKSDVQHHRASFVR